MHVGKDLVGRGSSRSASLLSHDDSYGPRLCPPLIFLQWSPLTEYAFKQGFIYAPTVYFRDPALAFFPYLPGPPASRVVLRPRRFIFSRLGTKDEASRTKITAVRWRYGHFKEES